MGWFNDDSEQASNYNTYQNTAPANHQAHLSHEVIGGAAAYEAMKAYEDHVAAEGRPDNHAQAKEIAVGLAGAFIDREFETKGLDFFDREKAKYHAKKHIEEVSANDFGY